MLTEISWNLVKILKRFPEKKVIFIFLNFLWEKYRLNLSFIGRENIGKFPEKSRQFPAKLRNFQKKKRKKLSKFREITAGFFGFFLGYIWILLKGHCTRACPSFYKGMHLSYYKGRFSVRSISHYKKTNMLWF